MSPDSAPILNVSKLTKRFGGFYALDGLSFHVASGEILGLVGPNGSGKTTAINVISGLYAPDGGEVVLDGTSIGGVASHRLVHRGINRTFQIPKPFLSLTVRQNIGVIILYGVYNLIGFTTPQYFQLIYGLLIMGLVLFLPAGLVSLATRRGWNVP